MCLYVCGDSIRIQIQLRMQVQPICIYIYMYVNMYCINGYVDAHIKFMHIYIFVYNHTYIRLHRCTHIYRDLYICREVAAAVGIVRGLEPQSRSSDILEKAGGAIHIRVHGKCKQKRIHVKRKYMYMYI